MQLFFYQTLRSRQNQLRNSTNGENKWHEKLETTLSLNFWDRILKIPQKLLVPNKMKWTQIQLNKHLLPTNYTVNKYDAKVSPLCSFCSLHPENLHLLFWGCEVVQEFWCMITNLVRNFLPKFQLGRKEALFGDQNSPGSSVVNTILILSRYFIWKQKFTSKKLDEVTFINYMRDHLLIIF